LTVERHLKSEGWQL